MKQNLLLHVGVHKTATTTIQAALSRDRDALRRDSILYPSCWPPFPREIVRPTKAHHRFAHAVAGTNWRGRAGASLFSRGLARRAHHADRVVLSSEAMFRHRWRDTSYPDPREAYLVRVRGFLGAFDVTPLIYLRQPHRFAESLFKEKAIKVGISQPSFANFVQGNAALFDFHAYLLTLERVFGKYRLRIYDDEAKTGILRGFYREIGARISPSSPDTRNRVSISNRALMWLVSNAAGSDEAVPIRLARRIYAALDPDSVFKEDHRTTLWPDRDSVESFADRFRATFRISGLADLDSPREPAVIWTPDMDRRAEERFSRWCDANRLLIAGYRFRNPNSVLLEALG